jgi:hypothetical protein
VNFNRRFGVTYRLHLQGRRIRRTRYQREKHVSSRAKLLFSPTFTLKMQAIFSFETSVGLWYPHAFTLVSCLANSSTLKMEPACSSEMSLDFQRTVGHCISEDHRCENPKSHQVPGICYILTHHLPETQLATGHTRYCSKPTTHFTSEIQYRLHVKWNDKPRSYVFCFRDEWLESKKFNRPCMWRKLQACPFYEQYSVVTALCLVCSSSDTVEF